jgi:hypothetical protein
MIIQVASFMINELFMVQASLFINGSSGEYTPAFSNKLHSCSVLKKKCNAEYGLLKRPLVGHVSSLQIDPLINLIGITK